MNRQPSKEELSRIYQRWKDLKTHYGDRADMVPEFASLTRYIKSLQQSQQLQRQRQAQNDLSLQQSQQLQQQQQLQFHQQTQMQNQLQNLLQFQQPGRNTPNNQHFLNQLQPSLQQQANDRDQHFSQHGTPQLEATLLTPQLASGAIPQKLNQPGVPSNGTRHFQNTQHPPQHQQMGFIDGQHIDPTNSVFNQSPVPVLNQRPASRNLLMSQSPASLQQQQHSMQAAQSPHHLLQVSTPHSFPMASNPSLGQTQVPIQSHSQGQEQASAFTAQQGQLVTSQFEALQYLMKAPGQASEPVPRSLVEFVTSDKSAFPTGAYLSSSLVSLVPIISQGTMASQLVPQRPQMSQTPTQQQSVQPSFQHPMSHPEQALSSGQQLQRPSSQQSVPQYPHNLGPSITQDLPQQPIISDRKGSILQFVLNGVAMLPYTSAKITPPANIAGTPLTLEPESRFLGPGSISAPNPRAELFVVVEENPASAGSASKAKGSIQSLKKADPQPPVLFEKFVKGNPKLTKAVVPVHRPNAQVNCFEFPQLMGDHVKEIPFNALYAPQSRLQFPGLLPEGVSMQDVSANREALISIRIQNDIDAMKATLSKLPEGSPARVDLEIELSKLELLPYQKEVRGNILSQMWFNDSLLANSHPNFLAKFGTLTLANVFVAQNLYQHQLHTLVQERNQKHHSTVDGILQTREAQIAAEWRKRENIGRISTKIASFHQQTAREEQKRIEKMAKQRLQALKSNDEEAYLKLLDHTKDTRITHLLRQTNLFLDSLAQAVQTQQKEATDRENGIVPGAGVVASEPPTEDEKREKIDYYHVAHRIKEEVTKQPDMLVGGTLKDYQLKGLQWMVSLYNNHLNGILADEMGLGKTIQTLSLITYLVEMKKVRGPFLVIVPLSTLTNWNLEFEKWAPALNKITYKGTPNQRKVLQQDIRSGNFQVLLTTFEYIIKDKGLLGRIKWVHMIIDEGHRMKNANSKLSETLTHHYHSDYRLILTGTPLQNNLPELWALLNFVLPKIFNSVKSFDEWFNTPFSNTGGQDKIELSEEETLLVIRRLHKVLRPFLLRRLKKDVEKDLPDKVEKVVKCKMSALQSKLYQQMLKFNVLYTADSPDSETPTLIKNTNNQIMQLRKICNHPFVYEDVENFINPTSETNDDIWRVAGKFELLDKVLIKFKKTGHRVLIFFQMTQIMDIMEDFLRSRNLKYMRLDGSTKADDRTALLKLFNAPGSDYFCFLLSTRAGGLGLNLQTADTVVIFDTDWNPHQDLQAQDRAHRIGQKNEVRILRLITEDSVEEMILERAHAKLEIDGKVIQAGKFDNKSTAEEQEAMLRALLEKEEERKLKGVEDEDDNLDDDELNRVIARNVDELETFRKIDEERARATREAAYPTRLYSEAELPPIYTQDPAVLLREEPINSEDYGRGNRERKAALYDDNLTEEQWLRQIDGVVSGESDFEGRDPNGGGGDDSEFAEVKPKKPRGRPRSRPKQPKIQLDDESDDDAMGRSKKRRHDSQQDFSYKRPKLNVVVYSSIDRVKLSGRGRGRPALKPANDVLSPQERSQLQGLLENMYYLVLEHRNEHGRRLSDLFMVKPSRKLYPDYYVLIKYPIALDTIKKRITTKLYNHPREALEDLHLIFLNARIYNEEGLLVYEDAKALEELSISKFTQLALGFDEQELSRILDFSEFDQIFNLKPLVIQPHSMASTTAPAIPDDSNDPNHFTSQSQSMGLPGLGADPHRQGQYFMN